MIKQNLNLITYGFIQIILDRDLDENYGKRSAKQQSKWDITNLLSGANQKRKTFI